MNDLPRVGRVEDFIPMLKVPISADEQSSQGT